MRYVFFSISYFDSTIGNTRYSDGTYGYEGKFDIEEYNKFRLDIASKAGIHHEKFVITSLFHLEK